MIQSFFLSVIIFFLSATCTAQTPSEEIIIQKNFFGVRYFQNDRRLTPGDMAKLMEPNAEAYKFVRSGRTMGTFSAILSSIGGFLIGYPAGAAINGQEVNWTLAAVGGGLVVSSIPFQIGANNKIKKAVGIYNMGAGFTSQKKASFSVGSTNSGLGLSLHF